MEWDASVGENMSRLICTYVATLLSINFLIALYLCIDLLKEMCNSLVHLIGFMKGLGIG